MQITSTSEVTTSKPTDSKWITSEPTASGAIDTRKGDKENLSSPVPSGVSPMVPPVLQISGGTNITINFSTLPKLT